MKKKVIIGGTLEDMAKDVIDVWHRAERGEKIEPQEIVRFISFKSLWKVMTDRRHALLKHLRRHPEPSIRSLATALKRDYKNVHEDVKALTSIGLIDTNGRKLSVNYDEIRSSL